MINKLIIDNEIFKPIIKIAIDDKTFIIYTKNEVNIIGDIICYVGSYKFLNGMQVISKVEDKNMLEVIDNIFMQVQSLINKKESGN